MSGDLSPFEKFGLILALAWIVVGLILIARNVALIVWSAK